VGKRRYFGKVMNGSGMGLSTAIKRFCGLPIGLIMLPVVTENARVSISSLEDIL